MILARSRRGQEGLASIVVVSVLIVLLTLISLGFAKIMSRSVNNSTSRQLSSSATYAAQSAINDVIAYMRDYATNPAHSASPWIKSDNCQDLIRSGAGLGPLSSDVKIGNNTSINCILLNPTPYDLSYTSVGEQTSQIIKLSTSAFTGSLNSMMVSWQSSNQGQTNTPGSCCSLPQETNSGGSGWSDDGNVPIMRLTLYPVTVDPTKATMDYMQTHSRTVFLYPQNNNGGNVPCIDYAAYVGSTCPAGGLSDGRILPVHCNGAGSTNPNFDGAADYQCSQIIGNLKGSVDPGDQIKYFYVRLTPIYGSADIKVKANDFWNQKLRFIGSQAILDITATASNVSKRLQARVDISNILSDGGNEASNDNNVPEDSLRSATTLCKRAVLHHSFFDYVSLEAPAALCGSPITTPAPSLTFSITGRDDMDNGTTVGSGQSSPRNPQAAYNGTVFVGTQDRLNWQTKDITQCSTGGSDGGWNGYDVLGNSSKSGTTGTGSLDRSFAAPTPTLSTIQTYTLSCSGPGGGPVTGTVRAWPPPRVKLSSFGDVFAGEPVTVKWNVADAIGCDFSGDWTDKSASPPYDGSAASGSRNNSTAATDAGTTKTYTITCHDPAGRIATDTISINIVAQPPPAGGGTATCGGQSGGSNSTPDACYRDGIFVQWSGNSVQFNIWASHCYNGIDINGFNVGWDSNPPDNSTYHIYTVPAPPLSITGGTANVTCHGSGSSVSSGSINYPAQPGGPGPGGPGPGGPTGGGGGQVTDNACYDSYVSDPTFMYRGICSLEDRRFGAVNGNGCFNNSTGDFIHSGGC
jgi:hypothetical protein